MDIIRPEQIPPSWDLDVEVQTRFGFAMVEHWHRAWLLLPAADISLATLSSRDQPDLKVEAIRRVLTIKCDRGIL